MNAPLCERGCRITKVFLERGAIIRRTIADGRRGVEPLRLAESRHAQSLRRCGEAEARHSVVLGGSRRQRYWRMVAAPFDGFAGP